MKKRIILIVLLASISFILTGCDKNEKTVSLMDYGEYRKITIDNIKQIEIIKYTEGESDTELVENDEYKNVYNSLKEKKIGKKTNMACDDNTIIYVFTLKDDSKISIEIECEWVVIGDDRFILK